MLVTMATPISSHVKDKNSIFTVCGEDMIFLLKGEILVFHQYLYNKPCYHLFRMCCFIVYRHPLLSGKQGCCCGDCTRLSPMWPRFDSQTRRHKWLEFVLVLFSASRVFLRVLRFSSPSKNQHAADSIWL